MGSPLCNRGLGLQVRSQGSILGNLLESSLLPYWPWGLWEPRIPLLAGMLRLWSGYLEGVDVGTRY